MDIGSGNGYPQGALSNFTPHPFVMDGVPCNSMEGFLQALKFNNIDMQEYVCSLVGIKAKMKGKNKRWYRKQILYWQGIEYPRNSVEYQLLLTRAYDSMFENIKFRKALKATNNATLTHSIGKSDINKTVLTENEFCSQLYRLRRKLDDIEQENS